MASVLPGSSSTTTTTLTVSQNPTTYRSGIVSKTSSATTSLGRNVTYRSGIVSKTSSATTSLGRNVTGSASASSTSSISLDDAITKAENLANQISETVVNTQTALVNTSTNYTFTVTTLDDSGKGSLRESLTFANQFKGPKYYIFFGVAGTIVLKSNLPNIENSIVIDGTSAPGSTNPNNLYSGYSAGQPVIGIDFSGNQGLEISLQGNNCIITGLELKNASNSGLTIFGVLNKVSSCFIHSNQENGVIIIRGQQNEIGLLNYNPNTGDKIVSNVINNNKGCGVVLDNAANNTISNNYIGVDYSGSVSQPNSLGIYVINQSSNTTIGGPLHTNLIQKISNNPIGQPSNISGGGGTPTFVTPLLGNLISGNNQDGIQLVDSSNTILMGNFVGTNYTGNFALANGGNGLNVVNCSSTFVKGTGFNLSFMFYNIFSGNSKNGIELTYSSDTYIQGNFIGIGANNNQICANMEDGLVIGNGTSNTVLGKYQNLANVISGNNDNGIRISGSASNFKIYNTFGGLFAYGDIAANNKNGLLIMGDNINKGLIGDKSDQRSNVFSGNKENGIKIIGKGSSLQIEYLKCGIDFSGERICANQENGIHLDRCSQVKIGNEDKISEVKTIISGNLKSGILLSSSSNVEIIDCIIGLNGNQSVELSNLENGIKIDKMSTNNIIGTYANPNVICANEENGIKCLGTSTKIIGNFVGVNVDLVEYLNLKDPQILVNSDTNTVADNSLPNSVTYYNPDSANISEGVSTWQGMARYVDGQIIICGTTQPSPTTGSGLVYIGNIKANSPSQTNYTFLVPGSIYTSCYGPRYNPSTEDFTLVGSYNITAGGDTFGFLYRGNINDLSNPDNYVYSMQPQQGEYTTTFVHSTDGNFAVGASGNVSSADLADQAWIYNISNKSYYNYSIDDSLYTTIYGIVFNADSYTICGGYTPTSEPTTQIGFMADFIYDSDDDSYTFSNTSFISDISGSILIHFEGISKTVDPNIYTMAGDGFGPTDLSVGISALMERVSSGGFSVLKVISADYQPYSGGTIGITTTNSVLDNDIVGYYIGNDSTTSSFQASIDWGNIQNADPFSLISQLNGSPVCTVFDDNNNLYVTYDIPRSGILIITTDKRQIIWENSHLLYMNLPVSMVFDKSYTKMYVVDFGNSEIYVLDVPSGVLIQKLTNENLIYDTTTFPFGVLKLCNGGAMDATGDYLYVTNTDPNYNNVIKINLTSANYLETTFVADIAYPILICSDNRIDNSFFVSSLTTNSVYRITNDDTSEIYLSQGDDIVAPRGVLVSNDGLTLYVTNYNENGNNSIVNPINYISVFDISNLNTPTFLYKIIGPNLSKPRALGFNSNADNILVIGNFESYTLYSCDLTQYINTALI